MAMNSVVEQTEQQTVGAPVQDDYKYWAFISYSHQDEEWAGWLHKQLETYRVPRRLLGRQTKSGVIPRRLFPVFRDRDELPGASDLGGNIKSALRQSRYLVVICSPKSAVSKWVNEEVKGFKALGRENRVLCLIVDGEPNATDKPESGLLECFPPAVRHKVAENGELLSDRTEPIAADARKGKDGRDNAKLKLLSGILDVGYDELKQRERQRVIRQRVRMAAMAAALLLLIAIVYVMVADAGLNVPAGARLRTLLDRHEMSLLRPVHSEADIRRQTATMRSKLFEALKRGHMADGWVAATLKPNVKQESEIWSHSQALSAIFSMPLNETPQREEEIRSFASGVSLPFNPGIPVEHHGTKYGWTSHPGDTHTQAEPALWTVTALAKALGRPGLLDGEARARAEANLRYAQEALKLYYPQETGGWNMFPRQKNPAQHNTYTTALALLALLEVRQANLPWEGSTERRDALLKATAQWLIEKYDERADPPGWRSTSESTYETLDGLTLQIYSELLRAEAEAGVALPAQMLEQMARYLASCVERKLDFPVASGEFSEVVFDPESDKETMDREAIGFLWYPWAINACVRWLGRAEKHGAPMEERVRVRRALSHLVVDIGQEAADKASAEWTFQDAETLYGLGVIPPP